MAEPDHNPLAAVDQIKVSEPELSFAIIGDTRPATIDDTAGYPTAVITKIFQDLQSTTPRPGFVVGTGDYQFSRNGSTTTGPQLDLYLQARAGFSNPEYPAMGNHECTGATASNCGPGTKDGATTIYNTYLSKVLAPLGVHTPYYSVLVTPPGNAWSAKIVFVAANAWTATQATWLDGILSQPTTYTFVVRHENSTATTAPGVTPSAQIMAKHPFTMLIVGHTHTYKHVHQKEIIVGNGGAPLTTGSAYGYGIVSQRSDGAIQFAFYNYKTHAVLDSFAVNADGTPASDDPPPSCAHDLCTNGSKLDATCDPCVGMICSSDSYCCTNGWNSICVGEVASICGQNTCSGGTGSCAHAICSTGDKLTSGCDACVTQICAKDSFCCATNWDSACVAEVGTICGETCN